MPWSVIRPQLAAYLPCPCTCFHFALQRTQRLQALPQWGVHTHDACTIIPSLLAVLQLQLLTREFCCEACAHELISPRRICCCHGYSDWQPGTHDIHQSSILKVSSSHVCLQGASMFLLQKGLHVGSILIVLLAPVPWLRNIGRFKMFYGFLQVVLQSMFSTSALLQQQMRRFLPSKVLD